MPIECAPIDVLIAHYTMITVKLVIVKRSDFGELQFFSFNSGNRWTLVIEHALVDNFAEWGKKLSKFYQN